MAASGSPPTLVLKKACKLPGNRCHIPAAKQAYKFNFDVTNNSPYTIYICDATFSLTGTSVDPLVWVPPVGGCLTVPRTHQRQSTSTFSQWVPTAPI